MRWRSVRRTEIAVLARAELCAVQAFDLTEDMESADVIGAFATRPLRNTALVFVKPHAVNDKVPRRAASSRNCPR